ncbi:MAG: hypothetical protein O7G85_12415 [Planctomycetota bacterium]|nr:hypothetical protein [Planctomycetota bacterium]
MLHCDLAIVTSDGWHLGINDSSLMGWGIVAGYLVTAILCGKRCSHVATLGPSTRHAKALLLWGCLALGLLLLGFNKQLDLQTWLTMMGRKIAWEQGWYEHRRIVQALFVTTLGMITIGGCIFIGSRLNHASRRSRLALLGAAFLAGFVVTRAASFHHLDAMLKSDLAGMKLHWFLELGGIVCIALAAGWRSQAMSPVLADVPSSTS